MPAKNCPLPASIVADLKLALANHVQLGQSFANGAIRGQQETVSTVFFIRRFRHGAKNGIFLIQFGGRDHIIAQVIGDMFSALVYFHDPQVTPRLEKYQE